MNYLDNLTKSFLESSGMAEDMTNSIMSGGTGASAPQSIPMQPGMMQQEQMSPLGGPAVGHVGGGPIEMSVQGGSPSQDMQSMIGGAAGAGDLMEVASAFQNTQNLRTAGLPGIGGALINMGEMAFDKSREGDARKALKEQMNLSQEKEEKAKLAEQDGRFERVFAAASEHMNPEQAQAIAREAAINPDVAKKFFEQIGDKATAQDLTEATRSRNQRLEFAQTEEGKQLLDGMSPAERRAWLTTGQQLPKGNVVNVETGTIPQDYKAVRTPDGKISHYEVIPGSKTDKAMKHERIQLEEGWRSMTQNAANMVADSEAAMDLVSGTTTGFVGTLLRDWPGSKSANLQTYMDTLRANIGFDRLQQMRQASTTGGALGNVSNREIELLYNSMTPLGGEGPIPSKATLERSLGRIGNAYKRIAMLGNMSKEEQDRLENMSGSEYWAFWKEQGLGQDAVADPTGTQKKKERTSRSNAGGYGSNEDDLNKKYGIG